MERYRSANESSAENSADCRRVGGVAGADVRRGCTYSYIQMRGLPNRDLYDSQVCLSEFPIGQTRGRRRDRANVAYSCPNVDRFFGRGRRHLPRSVLNLS